MYLTSNPHIFFDYEIGNMYLIIPLSLIKKNNNN